MAEKIVSDFTLLDQNGNEFNLYKNLGNNQKVLLVFYPRDSSLVCTKQLKDYSVKKDLFNKNNLTVVGVNIGNRKSHSDFCNNSGIDFPLLVDEDKTVSRQFDALNFLGANKRKLVLIAPSKVILLEKNIPMITYLNTDEILNLLIKEKIL